MTRSETLNKDGGSRWPIKALDLALLLYFLHRGAQDPEIGVGDARESLETLTKQLNQTLYLDPSLIESTLWSAGMLEEKNHWWHPNGLTFEEWVKRINNARYDRRYGLFERKPR